MAFDRTSLAAICGGIILCLNLACSAQESPAPEYRVWTTPSGRQSNVKLKFVRQNETSVTLQREDNEKVVGLQIQQLSRKDQQYLRELRASGPAQRAGGSNWSRFRGTDGTGVSSDTGLPLEWNATKNIVWKTPLPGPGASSPITFGNRIYLTCYTGYGLDKAAPGNLDHLKRHLLCIGRDDGKILWTAEMNSAGTSAEMSLKQFLDLHGYASSSPTVDASGVFVFFGTSGAVGYTHDGKQLWNTKLGTGVNGWGSASSPILFEDLLIVHADIEANSLVALNKKTGKEVWRVATGQADSWSTPLLAQADGRQELVFHHSQGEPNGLMAAVNPRDGKQLWQCKVLKNYLCPSPISHDGIIYAIAYQRGVAIRSGGQGDITDSHIVWDNNRGSEICTPVYHDGYLYYAHQENGIAYCVNAKTGETVYQERLKPSPGKMYASGVLADGRLYYVSRESGAYVVAAKPQFEQLAHNTIDSDGSIFNGTPAISRGRLLIRSNEYLYCIGEEN